jgi:hypothetical protein
LTRYFQYAVYHIDCYQRDYKWTAVPVQLLLEDTDNLPAPAILATEIVEQLEAALEEFRSVEEVLALNSTTEEVA